MTYEEIKEYISTYAPNVIYDETGEWLNLILEATEWQKLASVIKEPPIQMDFLFCLTCVDWKTHLTMVYHLSSTKHRQNIVIKVDLAIDQPTINTVSAIWRTAEFHEREVFEMFGVDFINHPDLRKLILEDDFKGYPLRKDFEDPINMIKL